MCNKIALTLALSFRPQRERGFKNQRGISLILVLFLIVILLLLVAAMVQLNRGGSSAVSIEIQSTRALFAAESGAQIAAMKIFPINTPINTPPTSCPFTSASQTFSSGALSGCTANFTCASATATTAGNITVFTVTSEGKCSASGSSDYTRRKITVGLRSM